MFSPLIKSVLLLAAGMLLCACLPQGKSLVDDQGASLSHYDWQLPQRIGLPHEPADNLLTEEKFQLGRHLFYDTRLSQNNAISCASCHQQDKAFSDGLARPRGATGDLHPRNSQGLANVAWNSVLTWANPSLSKLEQQIMIPLFGDDPIEHGINASNEAHILSDLRADPIYQQLFLEAYPDVPDALNGDQTWSFIVKALASFVRGLTSYNSPYDQYIAGDTNAISLAARRGEALFNGERLECFHCHEGYNFSNATIDRSMSVYSVQFHNTGLYNIDGMGSYPVENQGAFEVNQRQSDMGAFRAQSLRNVAVTAPYMHDGSIASLEEVIRTYAAGGRNITSGPHVGDGRLNPYKDSFITGFSISDDEISDVVAFLQSLTDDSFLTHPRFANPWN